MCASERENESFRGAVYGAGCRCGAGSTAAVSDATLTSGIHTIDPTSNQQMSKLPLNYLIDQLERPGSVWARRGDGASSLQVKQGGAVCLSHRHAPSLAATDLQL